jgi:hypothetical protein
MKMQAKQADMQIQTKLTVMKLAQNAEMQQAKIHKLEAEAILAIEQAGGIKTGHDLAMLDAQIGMAKAQHKGMLDSLNTVMTLEKHMTEMNKPQPKEGEAAPE